MVAVVRQQGGNSTGFLHSLGEKNIQGALEVLGSSGSLEHFTSLHGGQKYTSFLYRGQRERERERDSISVSQ